MADFLRDVRDHPTVDSFGLGMMPVLFSWMTPEMQRERARYMVDLGTGVPTRSGFSAYWDVP